MNENLVTLEGCKATAKRISKDEIFLEYDMIYDGGKFSVIRYGLFT